jgi:hypothetical protein
MFALGLTGVLYSRAGRAIFLLPLLGVALVGLFQMFTAMGIDLGYGMDRLASGTDTRTEVWLVMLEDAVNAPLLGSGDDRKGGVENAFLLGWVIYGPMMLMLMMLMVAASGFVCLKLMSVRSKLEASEKQMADFIIAFNAMYFAGAFFEWFIVARVDSTILLMCMTSAMAGRLIRLAKERSLGVWGTTEEFLYDDYGDDAATPAAG